MYAIPIALITLAALVVLFDRVYRLVFTGKTVKQRAAISILVVTPIIALFGGLAWLILADSGVVAGVAINFEDGSSWSVGK